MKVSRTRAWGALAGVLAGGIVALGPASTAHAEVINRSNCASYGELGRGQCFDYGAGNTWLGTYKNAAGEEFFCIDKNKSANLPANAPIKSTAGLTNKFGDPVGERAIAAINYIVWKWGNTTSDNRAAAIHLITREVMSDTAGDLPSGLTVTENVKTPTGMAANHAIMVLANEMWDEARMYHGNWQIGLGGDASSISVGESRTISATVTSRHDIGGTPLGVPGQTVTLTYAGGLSGPATAVTGPDGVAYFNVTATVARQQGSVSASVDGPAKNGKIFDPTDNTLQRGWIPKIDKESASLAFPIVVKGVPSIATETSHKILEPNQSFHDRVLIEDVSSTPRTATAVLYAGIPDQPDANSCTPERKAREVTFDVTGPAVYNTPEVTLDASYLGTYYTWVIHLPGDGVNDDPATTACGEVTESGLVNLQPQVETKAPELVRVLEQPSDTYVLSGLKGHKVPGVPVKWTALLLTPPVAGDCSSIPKDAWADAPVHDSDTEIRTADGTYTTRPVKPIPSTGCINWKEELLETKETQPFVHPAGLAQQTALVVKSNPKVKTLVQDKVLSIPAKKVSKKYGVRTRDLVKAWDIVPGDRVEVLWELYVRKPKKNGSCKFTEASWLTKAKVFDSDTMVFTQDGTQKTRLTKKMTKVLCYTFGEKILETPTHLAYNHAPGKVSQTGLVTTSSTPKIPTGFGGFTGRPLEQLMPWW